ncbi:MAG: T9SS type A sorting domain-containing protein [Bacteroidetes bacterium]|nr:T9SS type A sorting domain-containing protein [Bacteroidota bacterium]
MMMSRMGLYHDPQTGVAAAFAHGPVSWWKLPFGLILLIFISSFVNEVAAQGAVKYTLTYVAETTTSFQITDSVQAFSIRDQVDLIPYTTRDSVIKQVYTNNDIKSTIFHQLNTAYPAWMTRPAKTVIDKTRIKVYSATGSLMVNQVHSAKYKSVNSQLKSFLTTNSADVITNFVFLSAAMKTEYTANGFVMTNIGDGTFRFVKDSVTLYFNNTRRINQVDLFHSDGTLKLSVKRAFGMNSYGLIVPKFEIETRTDNRFTSHCVQEVKVTSYPYYHYTMAGAGKYAVEESEEDIDEPLTIEVLPNPADDFIIINIPAEDYNQPIRIYDNTGRLILEEIIQAGDFEIKIDISTFQSGMYFAQLHKNEALITQSFIKN